MRGAAQIENSIKNINKFSNERMSTWTRFEKEGNVLLESVDHNRGIQGSQLRGFTDQQYARQCF